MSDMNLDMYREIIGQRRYGDITINNLLNQVELEAADPKCCLLLWIEPRREKNASSPHYIDMLFFGEDPRKKYRSSSEHV